MSTALYRLRTTRDDNARFLADRQLVSNGWKVTVPYDDLDELLREYDRQNMMLRRAHAQLDGEPNHEEGPCSTD